MVESFTKASRDLHSQGNYGALSEVVRSEYGIHIIYYMGQCENLFTIEDNGNLNVNIND
jgi:hypothetical protein